LLVFLATIHQVEVGESQKDDRAVDDEFCTSIDSQSLTDGIQKFDIKGKDQNKYRSK
jgi:hypothetical protein